MPNKLNVPGSGTTNVQVGVAVRELRASTEETRTRVDGQLRGRSDFSIHCDQCASEGVLIRPVFKRYQ